MALEKLNKKMERSLGKKIVGNHFTDFDRSCICPNSFKIFIRFNLIFVFTLVGQHSSGEASAPTKPIALGLNLWDAEPIKIKIFTAAPQFRKTCSFFVVPLPLERTGWVRSTTFELVALSTLTLSNAARQHRSARWNWDSNPGPLGMKRKHLLCALCPPPGP